LNPPLILARHFRLAQQFHGIEERELAARRRIEEAVELVADRGIRKGIRTTGPPVRSP
jgi:hypothetical protein